jgi:hypothetical protein
LIPYKPRGISIVSSFALAGYFSDSFLRSPKRVSDFMIISPAALPPLGSAKILLIIYLANSALVIDCLEVLL